MKFEKDWLTPKDVSVLLGVTVRTIHNYIMSGKLNATTDDNGFKYIEKQDFFMQYPHLLPKYLEREKISNPEKISDGVMNKMLEEKINSLERIIKEKEQKVDMLKEQLNNSNQKEFKMLDAINSHARLLEHKEKEEKNTPSSDVKKRSSWWPFKKK